jgi:hypothetical protein
MCLRHGIGFDNFNPRLVLQAGKVLSGNFHLSLGGAFGLCEHERRRRHRWFRAFSQAVLVISHLLRDIPGAKTGEAGVFGTALRVWIMAVTASEQLRFPTARDDVWHRGVIARMPIGRNVEIANLSKRESRGASRDALRDAIIWRRLTRGLDWVRPCRRRL